MAHFQALVAPLARLVGPSGPADQNECTTAAILRRLFAKRKTDERFFLHLRFGPCPTA